MSESENSSKMKSDEYNPIIPKTMASEMILNFMRVFLTLSIVGSFVLGFTIKDYFEKFNVVIFIIPVLSSLVIALIMFIIARVVKQNEDMAADIHRYVSFILDDKD